MGSHEDCILPWLKINGSCPVCRHTLNGRPNDTPSSPNAPAPPETSGQGWSITNLFNFGGGNRNTSGPGPSNSGGGGGRNQNWRQDSMPPDEDID